MVLLIPGRHHLLTNYQFQYLYRFSQVGLPDGSALTGVVFAVTSSNHSGTRRNPLPLLARALQAQLFGQSLDVPVYIYGIPDIGTRADFAEFVIKTIGHDSSGRHVLTPQNTIIAGSTGVMDLYRDLGFSIFEAEATAETPLPWEYVERIASVGLGDPFVLDGVHPSSIKLWRQYGWDARLKQIFTDPLVGNDGDLTATRDYGTYVRQMDENARLKFTDTEPFLTPGRIGDIGCAVGSWLKNASQSPRFRDSDFFGIELARPLFEICRQRKENGDFGTPNVFFSQKNAVTDLCFLEASMNLIHTGSLTHEIFSYGSPEALVAFIQNRNRELVPGGTWINRDVVGCPDPLGRITLEFLGSPKGDVADPATKDLQTLLERQSPFVRFLQFVQDFRPDAPRLTYDVVDQNESSTVVTLGRREAQEFLLHKDYTDNWLSEMKESYAYWDFETWRGRLQESGFTIHALSRLYTNEWIRDHRWVGAVKLWADTQRTVPADWFPTTMVMVATKNPFDLREA